MRASPRPDACVASFRHAVFESELAGVREHGAAIDHLD
jgi:hypothetical protein